MLKAFHLSNMENVQFLLVSNDRLGDKINSLMRGTPLRLFLIRNANTDVVSREAVVQEVMEPMMGWRPAQRRFCLIESK